MIDLISRRALYERAATLEAQALDYVGKLTERDGEEKSVEWKIWSAILIERTAFKHDVYDAPSVTPEPQWIPVGERLPKQDDRVLVYTLSQEYHVWDAMPNRAERYAWEDESGLFHDLYEVDMWLSLPEPYAERKDNE